MPSAFPKGLPTEQQLAELDKQAPPSAPAPPPKRPSEGIRRTAATTSIFAKKTSAPPARKRPAGQGQTGSSSNREPAEAMAGLAAAGSGRTDLEDASADAPVDWKQKCEEWKQKYEEESRKSDEYHTLIAQRDAEAQRQSKDIESVRNVLRDKKLEIHNLESNVKSNEEYLEQQAEELADVRKQYDQKCKELASEKREVEGLTQWSDSLSKQLNELKATLQTKTNEVDDRTTDLAFAQKEIDNLKADNENLEAAVKENSEARHYVDVINERLESVFKGENNQLTPENFGNHLDRLIEQKELDHQSSEPSLNEQFKEKQPRVKNKSPERQRHVSLSDELHNNRTSDSLDAGEIADLIARNEELERERDRKDKKYDRLYAQKRNGETTIDKQAKKITDLETEKQRLIKSNREIQEQLSNPVETETRIKHVIHTQDATVWQAFCNASIWQKLLVTVLFLVGFTVTLSGYYERKMWLEANSSAWHSVQYANSVPMTLGFSSLIEDIFGFDYRLLG